MGGDENVPELTVVMSHNSANIIQAIELHTLSRQIVRYVRKILIEATLCLLEAYLGGILVRAIQRNRTNRMCTCAEVCVGVRDRGRERERRRRDRKIDLF